MEEWSQRPWLWAPILPLDAAADYANFWDVDRVQVEREPSGKLPQMYADMMGWPQQAEAVAGVFHALSPEDQSRVAIFFTKKLRLPRPALWIIFGPSLGLPSCHQRPQIIIIICGVRSKTLGEVVIVVGMLLDDLKPLFDQIELAATINYEYAIPGKKNNLPVYNLQEAGK